MAGLRLAEALREPTAPGGPWHVYGVALRPMPSWFPHSLLHQYLQLDAGDPLATHQALSPLSPPVTHLFWLALQTHHSESANISSNSAMLSNVLHALIPSAHLRHVTLQTGTKHYMGADLHHPTPTAPPPFREDTPRHPHPNFYYALEDLLLSFSSSFTWSVHRSSLILGASSRSRYNTILTLAAYALICRQERSSFRFPGMAYAWEHFCDADRSTPTTTSAPPRVKHMVHFSGGLGAAPNPPKPCINTCHV
ncbi:hypothetical protein ACLOJK_035513 [Asimina triloba]